MRVEPFAYVITNLSMPYVCKIPKWDKYVIYFIYQYC